MNHLKGNFSHHNSDEYFDNLFEASYKVTLDNEVIFLRRDMALKNHGN